MNFREMLKILEKMKKPTAQEIRQAAAILKKAGFKVTPPEVPNQWNKGRISGRFTKRIPTPGQNAPLPLPGWEEHVREAPRDRSQDDLLAGTMYDVTSSNVHSIGMRIDDAGDAKGTLLVRFLATHAKGVRSGPGSLYGYHDVPVTLFREFQRAASKGKFVWDELRVRGTIAGHKYAYELMGVVGQFAGGHHHENYVPRQAAVRKGQGGQHFIKRTFGVGEIRNGRLQTTRVESQLRPQQVSMRGPNPTRGPGSQALRFMGGR